MRSLQNPELNLKNFKMTVISKQIFDHISVCYSIYNTLELVAIQTPPLPPHTHVYDDKFYEFCVKNINFETWSLQEKMWYKWHIYDVMIVVT